MVVTYLFPIFGVYVSQPHKQRIGLRRIKSIKCYYCIVLYKLKKDNFEIYIADQKATTCIWAKLFLLRCVNPAELPLVGPTLQLDSPFPEGSHSWVKYSSRRTESSSALQHFASVFSLQKADAMWCENKRCSDSNPWPMDPKASVHYTTAPVLYCLLLLTVACSSRNLSTGL